MLSVFLYTSSLLFLVYGMKYKYDYSEQAIVVEALNKNCWSGIASGKGILEDVIKYNERGTVFITQMEQYYLLNDTSIGVVVCGKVKDCNEECKNKIKVHDNVWRVPYNDMYMLYFDRPTPGLTIVFQVVSIVCILVGVYFRTQEEHKK